MLHRGIRGKLTRLYLLLMAVVIAGLLAAGSRLYYAEFKEAIAKHHFAMLQMAASSLDHQFEQSLAQLARIAGNISLADLQRPERITHLLAAERDARIFFDGGFVVTDAQGVIVAESPPQPARSGHSLRHREYVQQTLATGNPTISLPYLSSIAPYHPTITLAIPIRRPDGTVAGLLAGRHDLLQDDYFGDLAKVSIGTSGYLFLFAANRTLIMHPDKTRIMEVIKSGQNAGFDRAIAGFEGAMENDNSRGVRGITSFKRLKAVNWIIASHYPLSEAYAPLQRATRLFGYVMALLIIGTLVLVWFAGQRITAPVLQLVAHLKRLPSLQGSDRQVSISSRDEIGLLATTFNEMVTELDAKQEQLLESQEVYRIMAEFTSELAVIRLADKTIRYISANCEVITGYSDQQFYANPGLLDEIIHPDEQELWLHHRDHLNCDGYCDPFDLRIITRQGTVRWLTHVCHTLRTTNGALCGTRGSFRDISERIAMEEKIQVQRDFMEQLMESSSTPMFVLDSQHRIIVWNRALVELTGYQREEMLDTSRQWEPFYPEQRPTLADLVLSGNGSCLADLYPNHQSIDGLPHIVRAEGWFDALHGKRRYLFFDAAPVYGGDGTVVAVVETLHDITARKQGEEALRLFQQAVDQSASTIVITDPLGTILYVNNKFSSLTGYSREEAIGQNPRILKSGRQTPEVYQDLWQTITAGEPWHGEFQNRRKDGSLYWELVTISPLFDNQQVITNFLAVKEDITASKEAEYKLRQQQAELVIKHEQLGVLYKMVEVAKKEWEETMDCIGDMVLLVGSKGEILRCNRAVTEFTGKSYDELKKVARWDELFSPDMDLGATNGETGELFHRPSGRWFYLNSYTFTSRNTGNSVVTLHDLTEVKKVSQELSIAYDELKSTHMQLLQQEKMASIGQLAAGVAHEINNPMGFISSNLLSLGKYLERLKTYIELQGEALSGAANATVEKLALERKRLKIDYLLEDIPKLLAESTDGAERVRTIVQNLKSFSRVDESELKDANLNDCLESTVSIAWNELKYKCTVEKEYGDLPLLKCHPQQLNQVFLNLMVNGAHAIDKQGTIRIRTWLADDQICVAISDTGSGIPAELRSRIFEPFFTTKAVGKGTGLGLSISYDIVKKHGGTIELQSEVGAGSTFIVRLPVAGPVAEQGGGD